MKKKIVVSLVLSMVMSTAAFADSIENVVVSLGSDLNSEHRQLMLDRFGVSEDVKIVEVTNAEERKYLGKYVDEKLIGSRAISSSYVEELDDGSGIEVETSNVTWVDEKMVQNALTTAGIEDAKVKVSAPFKVSGTAALTGIIKAFESATGENIGESEKQVANEEIAKTGELGQEVGKENAAELIEEVKLKVVEQKVNNPEEIRVIIEEKADELNVKLNEEQFQKIIDLMQNISSLNLDITGIRDQLQNISDTVNNVVKESPEARGLIQKIIDFFSNLLNSNNQ